MTYVRTHRIGLRHVHGMLRMRTPNDVRNIVFMHSLRSISITLDSFGYLRKRKIKLWGNWFYERDALPPSNHPKTKLIRIFWPLNRIHDHDLGRVLANHLTCCTFMTIYGFTWPYPKESPIPNNFGIRWGFRKILGIEFIDILLWLKMCI